MKLSLRSLREDDLEAVLDIEQAVFPFPWTRGNFTDAMKSGYACKAAELAGKLAGYAVLTIGVDEGDLLDLAIAPELQRQGLGRELLMQMLDFARELDLQRVLLEVRPSNVAALKLYREAGFLEVGVRRDYYPAMWGREDAIVMEYWL